MINARRIALVTVALSRAQFIAGADAGINYANGQVDWIRSEGGYFSPKLEFRHFNKADPKSAMGVFAAEDVPRGESLMVIPRDCLLTSGESSTNICDTAHNLIVEYRLGDESDFAPYVQYLFGTAKPGHLPSNWSEAGKDLLRTVIGRELLSRDPMDVSFEGNCGGSGDPLEELAYHLVHSRSWDDKMVPVFDMVNH